MFSFFWKPQNDDVEAFVYIYESEYEEIRNFTKQYSDIETGGDLFGTFTHGKMPVIWFVTGPGEKARHQVAEFSQDTGFTTAWQKLLMENYGIQYIGTWHSHHKLGLKEPSPGDVRAAQIYAKKHSRHQTIEIIVTYNGDDIDDLDIRPYFYPDAQRGGWINSEFMFLSQQSPIRTLFGNKPVVQDIKNSEFDTTFVKKIAQEIRKQIAEESSNERDSKIIEKKKTKVETTISSGENKVEVEIPISIGEDIAFLSSENVEIEVELRNEKMFMLILTVKNYIYLAVAFEKIIEGARILQVNLIDQNKNLNVDISKELRKNKVYDPDIYQRRVLVDIYNFVKNSITRG